MQVEFTDKGALIHNLSHFRIEEVFDCGQCFRFNRVNDESSEGLEVWSGVVKNTILVTEQTKDTLLLKGINKKDFEYFRLYLDLDRDYKAIQKAYLENKILTKAAEHAPGIRILHQDPFETLISFIISANNNIKRIKLIINRLCTLAGEELDENVFTFPTPERLASLNIEDLASLRAGWRDEYILDGAKKVAGGELCLEKAGNMELDRARKELQIVKGVGPKVAECVLLYGLGRLEAFPMDVWMKRAMGTLFADSSPSDFQPYPGIAQQYIFHYARLNPNLFLKK